MEADEHIAANSYIEAELSKRLVNIEEIFAADTLVCIVPIQAPVDDFVRNIVEDMSGRKDSLLVILETYGGSIETTERIADVFRHHYPRGEVSFLVPNFAMSAGTILVMSGDRILMDYYSVLGPIDPQIRNKNDQYVPALGYLEKFDQLIGKSKRGRLTSAELAFLIQKFDPAELHRFEQAREHSVDLLQRWLVQYKFKNWNTTKTRGIRVSPKMKLERAKEVARQLNDTSKWRSHGRGLSLAVLKSDLKLEIEDFGTDPALLELNKRVRSYYRLLKDYMKKRGREHAIQSRDRLLTF